MSPENQKRNAQQRRVSVYTVVTYKTTAEGKRAYKGVTVTEEVNDLVPDDMAEVESQDADEPEENELTTEEIDAVADTAVAVLQDVIQYFDVGDFSIDEYDGDEGELILDIIGDDLAILIGRHGKTLDSLQFLVSAITTRKMGFRYPVVVDVEGYKSRQREKLEDLAFSAAQRAKIQNRSIKLRPMNPYERRIIHITLRNEPGIETASEGEGNARRVVVIPR